MRGGLKLMLVAVGLSSPAFATSNSVASNVPGPRRVAQIAREAMAETGAKGLTIAVIENGRVRSVQAFGLRNAKGEPLTPDTVMYGASLTKMLFATLVMQLVDEGKIDLDKPLASYLSKPLPEYGNVEKYGNWGDLASDPRWQKITARHALTHSTGFANFAWLEPDKKLRIHFEPGSRYAYSGSGIMLLQFAVEQGLGLDVETELERRFFRPLGMHRTSLQWRPDFASNLADGWTAEGEVLPHDERSMVRAAGSMDTTISDFAKFGAALSGGKLLSSKSRGAMIHGWLPITTKQQFPTLLPEAPHEQRFPNVSAGLGVVTFQGPQGPGWYKGGHDDGTANTFVCVERTRRCVLVLSNDVRSEAAFPAIVRSALGETSVPYRWEYPDLKAWRSR